jgi:hypothetical protein
MLQVIRSEDGWMWKIEDTDFKHVPQELNGTYTDKTVAAQALDVFYHQRDEKLKKENATRLKNNKKRKEYQQEKKLAETKEEE